MKTKMAILFLVVALCVPATVLAHKPLLTVEDNGDGTIYVETGFSDGSSGAGHKILIRDKESGDVLSELKIPEEGYIEEIPIPGVPYTVTFDAGPGHVAVKDGPFSATEPAEATEPAAEEEPPEAVAEVPVESEPEPAAQTEPVQAEAAEPAQQPVQTVVQQPVVAQPAAMQMPVMTTTTATTVSPGMERALNMMMTTQMVSALAVLVVLGAIMFLIGYVVGKDAGKPRG